MTDVTKETYQHLYDNTGYGCSAENSPGLKFLPKFEHHLLSPLIDLGCGRGLLVQHLREKYKRRKTDGIDYISNDPELNLIEGSILEPLEIYGHYRCAVCMDVMEHLEPGMEQGVIDNLAQANHSVVSVHSGPSVVRPGGKELHINQRSWEEWEEMFSEKMTVIEKIPVSEFQCIFLMERKKRVYNHKEQTNATN